MTHKLRAGLRIFELTNVEEQALRSSIDDASREILLSSARGAAAAFGPSLSNTCVILC
jgi:hypothetical protein